MLKSKENKEILKKSTLETKLRDEQKPSESVESVQKMAQSVTEGVKSLGVESNNDSEAGFEQRVNEAANMLNENWSDNTVFSAQQATKQAANQAQIIPLKSLPTKAVMKHKVEKILTNEIHKLNREIKKVVNNPYELNKLMTRLRELRHFLARLATATYETIKNIYLKLIHGIA